MFYPDVAYGLILLLNGGLALVVSIFIIARGLENLQNTFMGIALAGFSVYLNFEGLIYVLQNQNLILVNFLRDISLVGVMIASFAIFMGGIFIYKGKPFFQGRVNLFIGFAVAHLLIMVIALATESIGFTGVDPTVMEFQGSTLSIILSHVYPVALIVMSLIFLYFVYQDAKRDEIIAKKILFLISGVLAVVIGALWMTTIRTIYIEQIAPPLIYLPGHLFYFLGSVIMFWAFKR